MYKTSKMYKKYNIQILYPNIIYKIRSCLFSKKMSKKYTTKFV